MTPLTEVATRGVVFALVLLALALAEASWPRHVRERPRPGRWTSNVGLLLVASLLVRLLQPAGLVGLALWAEVQGVGLWRVVPAPGWFVFVSTIVLLDLAVYAQHVLFHAVPWLWRLHRVHHADVDVDVTTGVRFHPIEMVLSMVIKGGVVVAWGGTATAVLVFEILLNATSIFTHANLALPRRLDRIVRAVLVTPDMHRVHHSVDPIECNSNFGFNLACWDRLFGTYRAQPRGRHRDMPLGLDVFRDTAEQSLDRLLSQPFRSEQGGDPPTAPASAHHRSRSRDVTRPRA